MSARILIVDDAESFRLIVGTALERSGYRIEEAASCRQAVAAVRRSEPDLAIVDYALQDGNALDLLSRWKKSERTFPVIVLTGYGSIDLAVRAIKEGAENFLTKPPDLDTLKVVVKRTLENERNRRGQRLRLRAEIDPFVGSSPAIRGLAREVHKILRVPRPILLQGETGSGKGTLAAWLHDHGPRAGETFVDVNCAGLSRELVDSELFGHEKGAFTGAAAAKVGLLEVAHRGTLFLDELGDLDLREAQPKLLKVLEEGRFRRLGSIRDRQVDIQLIASTNRDLAQMVDRGEFRSDLYFRLNTIPLTMPALRQREEDLPRLADDFLASIGAEIGRRDLRLSPDAYRALTAYPWPGNIRELRNVIERAALLAEDRILTAEDLRLSSPVEAKDRQIPDLTLHEVEIRHITGVLRQQGWHVPRTAERLGIPRSTLYQKIKSLGIELPDS